MAITAIKTANMTILGKRITPLIDSESSPKWAKYTFSHNIIANGEQIKEFLLLSDGQGVMALKKTFFVLENVRWSFVKAFTSFCTWAH
ncbi:MAG: hypothetical protein JRF18_04905 [Deltaproteobacteria bacterium]|nr:hypothetical protein [Deltaproteobacteria bacterium]